MPWLDIACDGFEDGASFPVACLESSPGVSWRDPGPKVSSVAVFLEDIDAAPPRVHWCVYDLPASTRGVPPGLPAAGELPGGGKQATNDLGEVGWSGPHRSRRPAARFVIRVYAVEGETGLPAGAAAREVRQALEARIRQFAGILVTYRQPARAAA